MRRGFSPRAATRAARGSRAGVPRAGVGYLAAGRLLEGKFPGPMAVPARTAPDRAAEPWAWDRSGERRLPRQQAEEPPEPEPPEPEAVPGHWRPDGSRDRVPVAPRPGTGAPVGTRTSSRAPGTAYRPTSAPGCRRAARQAALPCFLAQSQQPTLASSELARRESTGQRSPPWRCQRPAPPAPSTMTGTFR